ncbi:NAD(+)/NADH kinase [Acetonema longum]|uniref:NAD kinase n=1 Tax=Acetonema longum DSM 6540 TaxID=1009370 RepID=F7NJY9_9FIRM|nr:NAD(+)/NADH kinase [Acetonema longum]EGO63636.1 ATP-NAD/AcoX kinase [Acetonema longum DSM 6540]
MRIGLFPNTGKPGVEKVLAQIIAHLKEKKIEFFLPEESADRLGMAEYAGSWADIKQAIGIGITLGGDGTILHVARDLAAVGIPVCGINMGHLGFLTTIELSETLAALDRILQGDYWIEERLMLEASVLSDGKIRQVTTALNDVVITHGRISRLIRLNVAINHELVARYPADGLIIATPTGSTGYSLSAGGPIVNSGLEAILITPICPHTLYSRSLLITADETVQVDMAPSQHDITLTIDGQLACELWPEDVITVGKSPFKAKFVRFNDRSFYQTLQRKLRRGDIEG